MSRDCDHCQRLQATIDRVAAELAKERAEHRRTKDRAEAAERRARRWRWVAQIIHRAHQESHGQDR